MAKQQLSRFDRMSVVPYQPWRQRVVTVIGSVILILVVYCAYLYGRQAGFDAQTDLVAERNRLQTALRQSVQRSEELRLRVATLERGSDVDRQATEEVRQVNRELSDRIARLEEEVTLYQGIMAPSMNAEGLRVQEVRLEPTSSPNRYRYNLMLTQVGNNNQYLQGFVGVNLVGSRNGERVAMTLADVSDDVDEVDIRFRYRYFQEIAGDLVLPEGFIPDQIQVVAQAVGNRSARVERAYNWSDLENGNNVGQ
ncbi:DUF6776 family protein [Saccharospirillum mangrovi]|uniref:DUF6776 family protein n=1 Tax=Saccharospirillum mangrovi TaxID=2161747 RepID=UPI000D3B3A98|nr:DUF6776 family protein [Saccharospirillum mangrovi]